MNDKNLLSSCGGGASGPVKIGVEYFCISRKKGIFQNYLVEANGFDRATNSCTIASISIGWNDLVNS